MEPPNVNTHIGMGLCFVYPKIVVLLLGLPVKTAKESTVYPPNKTPSSGHFEVTGASGGQHKGIGRAVESRKVLSKREVKKRIGCVTFLGDTRKWLWCSLPDQKWV